MAQGKTREFTDKNLYKLMFKLISKKKCKSRLQWDTILQIVYSQDFRIVTTPDHPENVGQEKFQQPASGSVNLSTYLEKTISY